MFTVPTAARSACWLNAWLSGREGADAVITGLMGEQAHVEFVVFGHDAPGLSPALLLGELRRHGVTQVSAALPSPGDPLGLGGPTTFNSDALDVGEALVLHGCATGLVPRTTGRSTRWESSEAKPPSFVPDVAGADRALRAALTEAADRRPLDRVRESATTWRRHRTGSWTRAPAGGHPTGATASPSTTATPAAVGNVKYVWELSRHQHLTVLAAAYRLDGDERYAEAVAAQLRSWWAANPFLSGIHWTSGIELGLRLLSWVWIRRLLDGWEGAGSLFEENRTFLQQLHHHQEWLARLPSHGSSANNHLLAEMAGQFAAGCAFPWFRESSAWREAAATTLQRELVRQTFASGLNRELATDYHGFVLELGLVAALEGELTGHPLGDQVWDSLERMTDALAAVVDVRLRPPRQGDADGGHGLLLDGPGYDRWASLLATGAALFGPAGWWPAGYGGDARTALWTRLAVRPPARLPRPARRPSLFADAGMALLRDTDGRRDELWCRADHGPHGYLSIAAHAHADALAIEVRVGGVDVLADPGTYCYGGDPTWRAYFRSTMAHNTLEVGGVDQSVGGRHPPLDPAGPVRARGRGRVGRRPGGRVVGGPPRLPAPAATGRPPPEGPAGTTGTTAGRRGPSRRRCSRLPPRLPPRPRRRLHPRPRSGRARVVRRPRPTGRDTHPPRRARLAAPERPDGPARPAGTRRSSTHGYPRSRWSGAAGSAMAGR